MDSSVYLDNVRGFSKCLVRLSDVAFLVGENSSGKSSFLALAHLLLSEEFWANPDFNILGHELGFFDDLVSKASKARSSFVVGCVSRRDSDGGGGRPFGAVATFGKKDGSPRVVRCTYLHGVRAISYFRSTSGFRWIDHGDVGLLSTDSPSNEILRHLTELHSRIKAGAGQVVSKPPPSDRYLTLVMPHSIARILEGKNLEMADGAIEFVPNNGLHDGVWFAPIRAEPKRIYENPAERGFSPEGMHTPYLLRNVLRKSDKDGFEKSALDMISMFGDQSGLFKDIEIKSFGRTPSSPFSLSIKLDRTSFHLGEVGYGVSQILPIVAEMFAGNSGSKYFMQQPEVHLHPKAQAEIANVLYIYSSQIDDSRILVETHSDYLIERFRSLLREDYMECADGMNSTILWFQRVGGVNNVHVMQIDSDGNLPLDVPDGYRGFFLEETLRGLGADVDH